jgi:hypothetical protein
MTPHDIARLLAGRTITVEDCHWLSTLSNPHGSAIRTLKSQVPTPEQMQALARLTFANARAQVPKHRRRAGLPDFDFE